MSALWLVVVCLGLGFLVRRSAQAQAMPAVLNWWVLHVAFPSVVLVQIVRLDWSPALLYPGMAMWAVFFGSWLVIDRIGTWRGWDRGVIGAMVLTAGLGNTSFVGFPMVEALRGPEALGMAVIADQLGSFPMLSTVAVVVASIYAGQRVQGGALALRIFRFPAFLAMLTALLVRMTLGELPQWIEEVASRLGTTMTPLALFSVGLQLRFGRIGSDLGPMLVGMGWKLALAPLLVWGVGAALGVSPSVLDVAVLQAGMAPMITAGILAQQHGLAPVLTNRFVGMGILVSLVTVPLIHWMLL